jgi:uncharacterized membrane protein HdeD (DUF308 family)
MNTNIARGPAVGGQPASVLNVLAGIWLIISSWLLAFSSVQAALWDTLLVGIAVLVLAAIRIGVPRATGASWVNVLLGIWLIVAPFALGFTAAARAMNNSIVLGILVIIFGLWAAFANRTAVPLPR